MDAFRKQLIDKIHLSAEPDSIKVCTKYNGKQIHYDDYEDGAECIIYQCDKRLGNQILLKLMAAFEALILSGGLDHLKAQRQAS